ncbi:NAD(P)H-hydrate epimerase / ADP-dependent (S)-NAD(P)H-hydrate dehydratase [hydrothermal vent metagenome]|uniref:Nicotinamide nucleotide repair protein n=1 Tax=hydrothermal vent metagenome TaxID=652676 RepID=A0A3B0TJA3_9ZZZZ
MKIFTTKQIAEIDKYTIENEPIADIDLMERASLQIVNWLVRNISNEKQLVCFAGPGNNGGDALAIARLMAEYDYSVSACLLDLGKGLKGSPAINWQRLIDQGKVTLHRIKGKGDFPGLTGSHLVLDGLFGSGLTRALTGLPAELVRFINQSKAEIIAIDIPSGLMGEDNSANIPENIIKADCTLTFQFPKLSFLFPENEKYLGRWEVLPIGLHPEGIAQLPSEYFYLEEEAIKGFIPGRSRFEHKGTVGHALLIAGGYGKMGAAVLSSKACLRAGVGLLTTHVPRLGYGIIQTAVSEAMASIDQSDLMFTEFPGLGSFTAVGIGPGIGTKLNTHRALHKLIKKTDKPLVIDADALNIISGHKEWLKELPPHTILTPHPGEFKRLTKEASDSFERLTVLQGFAKEYQIIVVLKGAFTAVALPDGRIYFNPTGNPGMATAGSGDVLTGIILGLAAQGIPPERAALAGVYLHGLAGDIAAARKSEYSMIAGDITEALGQAFSRIFSDE